MNIVINAVLSYDKPRGVGRYINNLLPMLAEIDKNNHYFIYYGKWMKNYDFLKINQNNFSFIELDIKNTQVFRNFYLAFILPIKSKRLNPDLFFLIDTQAIILKPCKILSTIHDLAEYVVPEKYSKKQAFIRRIIVKHQIRISDHIITVSNYSKNDICSRFGINETKVSVVYNSVELHKVEQMREPKKYFLFVGEIERAKNLITLIQAYSLLDDEIKSRYTIEVVGSKGNDFQNVKNTITELGITDRVIFHGYVSDDELNNLYQEAYAFIFPSLFEGFGLPVLEAMAKGVPVICSNSSSIPEVGGKAVLTFDACDAKALSDCMLRIITNQDLRDCMIDEGIKRSKLFSMESAARNTLDIIDFVI